MGRKAAAGEAAKLIAHLNSLSIGRRFSDAGNRESSANDDRDESLGDLFAYAHASVRVKEIKRKSWLLL